MKESVKGQTLKMSSPERKQLKIAEKQEKKQDKQRAKLEKQRRKAQRKLERAEHRWQLAAFKQDIKELFRRRKQQGKG